jgi:rSAM/selenodomain-associated transferase 2/rSAM/selenodomain-associated transferase 1
MRHGARIAVLIPALNEERAVGQVIRAIPSWVDEIVVVDNGSTDRTSAVAETCGARVVREPRRGYGQACLAGMAALSAPEVVVFVDADFSDYPDEVDRLVDPILQRQADLVIGSRVRGVREPGALTLQALLGNWLACRLIHLFWGIRFTDLGPFRAARYSALRRLDMRDTDYGWTVEMQVKAAASSMPTLEVPVSYRRRIGTSKISGTLRGVILAGTKILFTIFREFLRPGSVGSFHAREQLLLFTRYPEPGKTKTRLIPLLGEEAAARLQVAMTAHALAAARELARDRAAGLEVRFEGGGRDAMRALFGPAVRYEPQGAGDLGDRMKRGFADAFDRGAESAVIVGADVPAISASILGAAFDALGEHDVVLGPATDGGYYLIGLRRPAPELFDSIPWGTGDVFQRTLAVAAQQGHRVAQLTPLADVDRPEDIPVLHHAWGAATLAGALEQISIVIPALNEAARLAPILGDVCGHADVLDVVVVDGGSTDGTPEIARAAGALVLRAAGGRAGQMNAGAAAAKGGILLFLHADTILPSQFPMHVRDTLRLPGVVGGAFAFRLDASGFLLRCVERCANWRARTLQMPYGDQALFMRRDTFDRVGGFPLLPIMEDLEIVRRLRRLGRIRIVPAAATTSARRWQTLGVFRTSALNQLLTAAYFLGFAPSKLARWYRAPPPKPRRRMRQNG